MKYLCGTDPHYFFSFKKETKNFPRIKFPLIFNLFDKLILVLSDPQSILP